MNALNQAGSQTEAAKLFTSLMVNVAQDFSQYPGARYRNDGPHSGEQFREEILVPNFSQAMELGQKLLINLDGTEGYATSFLEEAFGGLARRYGAQMVLDHLEFQSLDEPLLKDEIERYIREAAERK